MEKKQSKSGPHYFERIGVRPRNPTWVNVAAESGDKKEAAALALLVLESEGTDIAAEVLKPFKPLPKLKPDQAIDRLLDIANGQLHGHQVGFRLIAEKARKKGSPLLGYSFQFAGEDVRFWHAVVNTLNSPPRYLKLCPWCGSMFPATSNLAKFCSDVCRSQANKNK